jgi:hypothetical protein
MASSSTWGYFMGKTCDIIAATGNFIPLVGHLSWKTPTFSNRDHPCKNRIFHEINHPAMGVPPLQVRSQKLPFGGYSTLW